MYVTAMMTGAKRGLVQNSPIEEVWDFGEPMEVGVLTNWLLGSRG